MGRIGQEVWLGWLVGSDNLNDWFGGLLKSVGWVGYQGLLGGWTRIVVQEGLVCRGWFAGCARRGRWKGWLERVVTRVAWKAWLGGLVGGVSQEGWS